MVPTGDAMAPTGVANVNIDGAMIHNGLNIPIGHLGKSLPSLSNKMRSSTVRNRLSGLKFFIINEIPMVSNNFFYYIHFWDSTN